MNKRRIKVEEFERSCQTTRGSMIRLKGRWLEQAGFPHGASVELTVCSPGVIEIRLCAPPQLLGSEFQDIGKRLTEASARADARLKGRA